MRELVDPEERRAICADCWHPRFVHGDDGCYGLGPCRCKWFRDPKGRPIPIKPVWKQENMTEPENFSIESITITREPGETEEAWSARKAKAMADAREQRLTAAEGTDDDRRERALKRAQAVWE